MSARLPAAAVSSKKNDPFLDALSEDSTRPNTSARAGRAGRTSRPGRPVRADRSQETGRDTGARPAEGAGIARARFTWRDLPVPIQAALLFTGCIGLGLLLTPLVGRLVLGKGGLDSILLTFATESGVSALWLAAATPLLAGGFALAVYLNARTRVWRVAQSVSRGLLVVLLTWMTFGAWATRLWCLPDAYGSCYSTVLIVSGLLGGGQVLAAGLFAGWLVGRGIIGRRAGAVAG